MGKREIDGVEYSEEIIKAFCKASGLADPFVEDNPQWFKQLMASHLDTFSQGWQAGYEAGLAEAPNCDECDREPEPPDYDEP